jgi:hypothetical protein
MSRILEAGRPSQEEISILGSGQKDVNLGSQVTLGSPSDSIFNVMGKKVNKMLKAKKS